MVINRLQAQTGTLTVVFSELDYETARATTVEEAEKRGQEGWTKYDQITKFTYTDD